MNFKVDRKVFVEALNDATQAAARRATLPILECVKIEADPSGKVTFSCLDLELSVQVSVDADVKAAGSAAIPAKQLLEVVKATEGNDLEVQLDGKLAVKAGRSVTKLAVMPPEEFPEFPKRPEKLDNKKFTVVSQAQLIDIVDRVAFAASDDPARPVLNGVYFNGKSAATDGFRLSVYDSGNPGIEGILPVEPFIKSAKMFAEGDEITVGMDKIMKGRVLFFNDRVLCSMSLVDGKFPDYQQIIPQSFEIRATAKSSDALQACRQLGVIAKGHAPIKIVGKSEQGKLVFLARDDDGVTQLVIDAEVKRDFAVCVQSRFFKEGVASVKSDNVSLDLNDGKSPVRLSSPETEAYIHIMMPMFVEALDDLQEITL